MINLGTCSFVVSTLHRYTGFTITYSWNILSYISFVW